MALSNLQYVSAAEVPTPAESNWHEIHAARARQLHREERLNWLTHGAGFLLGIVGVALLLPQVAQTGDRVQLISCAVYGLTLLAVYLASTLSHLFHHTHLRRRFRILDQACIFLLIAGTFTPPALTYLREGYWWFLHGSIWTVALAGFASKAFFAHQIEAVSTTLHVALGWGPVVAIKPLLVSAPFGLFIWLLAGGICYTVGTVFLNRDRAYYHVVWHVLVIAGSVCHYVGIYQYCTSLPVLS